MTGLVYLAALPVLALAVLAGVAWLLDCRGEWR